MGFYVRKSLRAGPFRVNLSKSGIGMSVGVPGFRVGSGPRGNYVNVGAHGIYYRTTLGGGRRRIPPAQPIQNFSAPPPSAAVLMVATTGAGAQDLVPSAPGNVVDQLNAAAARPLLWPWLAVVLAVTAISLASSAPAAAAAIAGMAIPAVVWFALWEHARRTVVAFYDVTGRSAAWYDRFVTGFGTLMSINAAWRVESSGMVQGTYQYKVNSGASSLVKRGALHFTLKPPKTLTTNIAVPTMTSGRHALLFLPDRVLVRSGRQWSDVAYGELRAVAGSTQFIESGGVPRDAVQVDRTWQYVNVGGGPDRRFKNNRMLPIMRYGEVLLSSRGGLYWETQFSRVDAARWLGGILNKHAP